MLVWGVQPFVLEKFTSSSIDEMAKAAIDLAFKKAIVVPGNKVVIVAGALFSPGTIRLPPRCYFEMKNGVVRLTGTVSLGPWRLAARGKTAHECESGLKPFAQAL